MPIAPLSPVPPLPPTLGAAAPAAGSATAPGGFAGVLSQALSGLGSLETQADSAAQQLASGQTSDISTAVIAAEKANLGLSLAVEVRNQAISAYQQLMQLQM